MLLLSKCMMYIIMVIIYLLSLNFLSIPLPSWRHPSKAPYVSRGASFIAQLVKNLPAMPETQVQFLDQEDPLEKEMATHSSIFAWRIPWAEEPVQSMGSHESDTTESLERDVSRAALTLGLPLVVDLFPCRGRPSILQAYHLFPDCSLIAQLSW